jgi:hypothetical protein
MKRILNKETSVKAVNTDNFNKIELKSNYNLLPVGDVSSVINVADQFNKERQACSYYRISGNITPMFTNVLFNSIGVNSWKIFNNALFRDGTFPANGIDVTDEEDLTYTESIIKYLKENDGWYGYLDPDLSKEALCKWIDMEPSRGLFNLSSPDKNWEIVITYPAKRIETIPTDVIHRGIQLISSEPAIIGGRDMTLFSTPIKHGLTEGDSIRLKGLNNLPNDNGTFKVNRLGKLNGDDAEYYFAIDISEPLVVSTKDEFRSRVSRIYNGKESSYYNRRFEKVKMRDGLPMQNDDYEVYPLAFSKSIYEDSVNQFVINEDVDVSNLTDNLGRPISELFVTIIKTDSNGAFTNIKSGIKMPFNEKVSGSTTIPDINRITDAPDSHSFLKNNVNVGDGWFHGDIVEYNELEQKEKILGDVYHRFNTPNRLIDESIPDVDFNGTNLDTGVRREGYMYKAHHRIKIREYSTYIEQGTKDTYNLPSYSKDLKDGRYIWRDLLDIGFNDMHEDYVDYPYANDSHYLNVNLDLPLKRQDPFGWYNLRHTNPPADIAGELLDDRIATKNYKNEC